MADVGTEASVPPLAPAQQPPSEEPPPAVAATEGSAGPAGTSGPETAGGPADEAALPSLRAARAWEDASAQWLAQAAARASGEDGDTGVDDPVWASLEAAGSAGDAVGLLKWLEELAVAGRAQRIEAAEWASAQMVGEPRTPHMLLYLRIADACNALSVYSSAHRAHNSQVLLNVQQYVLIYPVLCCYLTIATAFFSTFLCVHTRWRA